MHYGRRAARGPPVRKNGGGACDRDVRAQGSGPIHTPGPVELAGPDTGAQQGLLEYRAGQIPLGRVRAIQPFLRKLSPVFLVATCGGGGEWSEERSRSGEFELTCRVDGMGG
jgi:hypothetical protein